MQPSAQQAIQTLTKLKQHLPLPLLAYWVAPNIILTLAGARAYCDGVFWGEQAQLKDWQQEADQSLEALKQIIPIIAAPSDILQSETGDSYLFYEILYSDGLSYALSQTALLLATAKQTVQSSGSLETTQQQLKITLRQANSLPPAEDGLDAAAIGILLGYPDKAIIGAIPTWNKNDPFAEPTIAADIRGCAYYNCPQPRYDYPRSLINDADITAHEQLWSAILRDYYTSDFHKSLEADEAFTAKLAVLELVTTK